MAEGNTEGMRLRSEIQSTRSVEALESIRIQLSLGSDQPIREMVEVHKPGWPVDGIDPSADGRDLVAILDVRRLEASLKVVFRATRADLLDAVVSRSEPRFLELLGHQTSINVPMVYGNRG